MNDNALNFDRVTVRRRGRTIVHDVSFGIASGSIHALLGHNGAGKTTLLRAVAGYVPVAFGDITLKQTPEVLFVGTRFPGDVSVGQIVHYRRRILNCEYPKRILDMTGVAQFLEKRGNQLSTGMAQRLGIALALMAGVEIVVMDEPTSGLDPQGVEQLVSIIEQLQSEGTTILVCSHDLARLEPICDSVTCLQMGRVTFSGSVHEAAQLVQAAGHIIRTSDDSWAQEQLSRTGVAAKILPRGLYVDSTSNIADVISALKSQLHINEVTVAPGLFDRIYSVFAASPADEKVRVHG